MQRKLDMPGVGLAGFKEDEWVGGSNREKDRGLVWPARQSWTSGSEGGVWPGQGSMRRDGP